MVIQRRKISQFSIKVKSSPVPPIWKTHPKGKIYVFNGIWRGLTKYLRNYKNNKIPLSQISQSLDINIRTLRDWKNKKRKPLLYTNPEFNFTKENLYWLGIFFSDGHLRNNGANLSFTYQIDSSNPFQGYWYPQFIQKFLGIFTHKKSISKTTISYSMGSKCYNFSTNLSSFSPIFAKFLETNNFIERKSNTPTTGYSKKLPRKFVNNLSKKDMLWQGLIDGDGSYKINNDNIIYLSLALDPLIKSDFINELSLVPTLCRDIDKKYKAYTKEQDTRLMEIRFAPSSLNKLPNNYIVKDIIDQFKFLTSSAHNSIRPDKVHSLIRIVRRISSKEYGEYKHCKEIQRVLRDEMRKTNLLRETRKLEKRYPIYNGYFKPFIPKWAEHLLTKKKGKSEFWDFFLNGESLNKSNYPNNKSLDFSEGVPTNFNLNKDNKVSSSDN